MTKQQLLARRDYFNMVNVVTLRAIAAFSDDELDFRPRAGMRTPRELVFHIYTQEKVSAEAARQRRFTLEMANASNPEAQPSALSALRSVRDVIGYAKACHEAAEDICRSMSEEDVASEVESPFGGYPAWQHFLFAYD